MTISRTVDGRFQSLPFSTCDPLGGRSFLGLAGGVCGALPTFSWGSAESSGVDLLLWLNDP